MTENVVILGPVCKDEGEMVILRQLQSLPHLPLSALVPSCFFHLPLSTLSCASNTVGLDCIKYVEFPFTGGA